MTTETTVQDQFDSAEYEDGRVSLPYLQLLNTSSANDSGLFITAENIEAAGFIPDPGWVPYSTTFSNGDRVDGYRSLVARLLILRKSNLLMYMRKGDKAFVDEYQKGVYNRSVHVLKQRYLVFLITKEKRLMNKTPLLLTAKGSFCGSFGATVRAFRSDMSKAYGAAKGAKKARGDRFMALSVLAIRLQPELKGGEQKSWVCSVSAYGQPTHQDWTSYFVGYDAETKDRVLAEFDAWKDFGTFDAEASQTQSQFDDPDADF